jgi:hypothetical protein
MKSRGDYIDGVRDDDTHRRWEELAMAGGRWLIGGVCLPMARVGEWAKQRNGETIANRIRKSTFNV